MGAQRTELPWAEFLDLHVVRRVSDLVGKRWRLGVGYLDALSRKVKPPRAAIGRGLCQVIQDRELGHRACEGTAFETLRRLTETQPPAGDAPAAPVRITCHAGLSELAAPILIDGRIVGALLVGGFLVDEGAGAERFEGVDRRIAALALPADDVRAARARHPWLTAAEVSFVGELLAAAADEIAVFHGEALRRVRSPNEIESEYATRYSYDAIIGRSLPMQRLYHLLDRVVQSDSTVLIQGDNGTGKELVARAIHYNSARKNRRFVVTNCSAFNDNLLDSELFGHKRGAFTGAIADKQGLFEVADKGTFFLDEIGDMSPALQVKVLRVLQEGTFIPVGDTEPRKVDVRIIAATNRDLKAMVDRGDFREDLYYRIDVINLVIPALRDRIEDQDLLVDHFLKKHAKGPRRVKRLSDACRERLTRYPWPGNVRELENEIERLIVLSGDERIIDDNLLSTRIRQYAPSADAAAAPTTRSLPEAVRSLERRMIREALERNGWNKTRASAELRISRRNLIRLVQKYRLETEGSA
jgi:two-component system, NtrC family, response regulator HupR/HoxA